MDIIKNSKIEDFIQKPKNKDAHDITKTDRPIWR